MDRARAFCRRGRARPWRSCAGLHEDCERGPPLTTGRGVSAGLLCSPCRAHGLATPLPHRGRLRGCRRAPRERRALTWPARRRGVFMSDQRMSEARLPAQSAPARASVRSHCLRHTQRVRALLPMRTAFKRAFSHARP
jgi:hypothetical protein